MAITFVHDGVPEVLPQDFTLCLFRIVQEALQNAIKHSRARQVSVRLVGDRDGLKLTIADDGVGFDLAEAWGRGLGLLSMSERLEPIDGTFKIDSTPGAGTRLEVVAPLPAEGAADAASA
jgi:signal transduction histidine kinase